MTAKQPKGMSSLDHVSRGTPRSSTCAQTSQITWELGTIKDKAKLSSEDVVELGVLLPPA